MKQIPFLLITLVLLLSSYFLGIEHAMIPTIGDELVYMSIAENTAESGKLLPLRGEDGVYNTKPPLLFWQGIMSTAWMQNKSYTSLRLPSLFITALTALVLIIFGQLLFYKLSVGLSAAVLFLCFFSTFKYGRHFLMHPHETLFSMLPLLWYIYRPKVSGIFILFAGICFGIVALAKSFVFAFVGGAALGVLIWVDGYFLINKKLFLSIPKVLAVVAIGLLIFSLWLILDPDPNAIYQEFILGENAGKFSGGFWQSIKAYPPWNVWLGPLWNAGFVAPMVIALVVSFFKKKLTRRERLLLALIVFYLLLFTFPSQRQSNYVLPAMLPLALLIANRFSMLPLFWTRLCLSLIATVTIPVGLLIMYGQFTYAGNLFTWPLFIALAALALSLTLFIWKPKGFGVVALAIPICCLYLSVDFFVEAFSAPWGRNEVLGWKVSEIYVPSNFRYKEKRYSFLIPDMNIQPYRGHRNLPQEGLDLLEQGKVVAMIHNQKDWPVKEGLKVLSQRPFLFERHSNEELKRIFLKRDLNLLFGYLSIVKKNSVKTTQEEGFE